MNILIISGSPREVSVTVRVAKFLERHFSQNSDHVINFLDVRDEPYPMIQNVWGSLEVVPVGYKSSAQKVFESDAIILVSPEYNGSYSPALKNLLDHFPKQSRKPFGIVTASPGMMGGIRASMQMQQMICAFFGIPSPHMLIVGAVETKFNENGDLIDESFQKLIDNFTKEFLWLAEKTVD
ncbi:NAD(P)H-dependent FMN reductase [Spirosomataceae bacterium TFI 002]|nr:NAD(P)H-dependent FMN reductase [Spirosomataceae bacterium TFI 002]